MDPLPVAMTSPLGWAETTWSYCSRVAHINMRPARDFCLDMGIRFQEIVDGSPQALFKLASVGRIDHSALERFAFRRAGPREYLFGNEPIYRTGLTRARVRICPHCIEEDLETFKCNPAARPYQRADWVVSSLRTCTQHHVRMVEVLTAKSHELHDFTQLMRHSLPMIDHWVSSTAQRSPSQMEVYVRERLMGQSNGCHWLDQFRVDAAARLSEVLGAAYLHGVKVRLSDLTEDQLFDAGAAGYAFAVEGENGIRSLLELFHNQSSKKSVGPKSVFSRLYEWLAHENDDPTYDTLREIVRTYCIETMPLSRNDELFGKALPARTLYSIRSASRDYELHPKRLRKLLVAAGLVDIATNNFKDEDVLFRSTDAHHLLEQIADSMSLEEAAVYLNAPRPNDRAILLGGFVKPLFEASQSDGILHAFARSDLDNFLVRLLDGVIELGEAENGYTGILDARRRANCSVSEILTLILEGRLTRLRRLPSDADSYRLWWIRQS